MKKSNTPNGLSLPKDFKEVAKRLKDKEPELDELIERDGDPDPDRTIDHLQGEDKP
jgi:hypothetical protein